MDFGDRSLPRAVVGEVEAREGRTGGAMAVPGLGGHCPPTSGAVTLTPVQPAPDLIVERAKAGDAGAFEALLAQHYRFVFRVACRWIGNPSDAEDITQTVCMRLADSIRHYDGRASFQGWLYRVTLNAVRDQQRASARRGRLVAAAAVLTEEIRQGDQEDALHIADIWRAVRALPEKQRDAILLVHGEGLSQAEAARVMGCREVTVSWHIHQARKALRGVL